MSALKPVGRNGAWFGIRDDLVAIAMDAAAIRADGDPNLVTLPLGRAGEDRSFQPQILRAPPKVRLAALVREVAVECPIQPRVTHFHFQGDGPYISRELVALLTLSYATRLFTLERIYEALNDEIMFRGLLSGTVPHPNTARAFRRMERPALVSSMSLFFERFNACLSKESGDPCEMKGWLDVVGLKSASQLGEPTEIQQMVVDRINQATWTDKMLLDF